MATTKKSPSPRVLKSSVKEAIGKLTGDVGVEAEGRREKREATSETKDTPRG